MLSSKRPAWRYVAYALPVAVVAWGGAIRAEPVPAYAQLLREAQTSAPALAERAANVRSAEGLADQAGYRPNPTVSLDVENVVGTRPYRGFSQAQNTLTASQTLELGGKRAARIAAGRASVEASRAQQRQALADFGYDLALAYVTAEAAQTRADLLRQDLERAADDLRVARALVDAGREADLRAVQAQAAVSATRAELQLARADAAEALGRLSAMVGAPAPYTSIGPLLLPGANALAIPTGEPPTSTPAVLAAEAERDAAVRRINVERTRATPNVTVSLGVRRLEGENATNFVGGVAVPFPLFDRNRGAISSALADRDAADARVNAARLEAEASWRAGIFRAGASQDGLLAAIEGESAAAEGYRLARIGYEAGRTPLVELLNARRALTEAQARTLDARTQRIRADATLARLAGRTPFGDAR
ncbi:MAG: transporter [Caulobacterales bacterium 32-69-10]|nr:MAG: transporter [Caulobacterales bacterium 32-69-10]